MLMNKNTINTLLIISAGVLAVIAGIWLGKVTQNDTAANKPPAIKGAILAQPRPLQDVKLKSVGDTVFGLNDFKGQWTLVFFGYTNCPDVCPNTLSVLNQVDKLMEEQGLAPPRTIFISIDPQRDKLDLIDQYVKYFNKKFIGITGDQKNLASITRQMSVVYAKAPGADGSMSDDNYLMDHSSSLILLNPEAQVQALLTAPHTPMQIIDSIVRTQVYYYE